MKKTAITIQEVRHAILYACQKTESVGKLQDITDEALLKIDFSRDLNIGNIRMANIVIELQRIHALSFPLDIFRSMPDNTVKSFIDTIINQYISQNTEN